jgi:hypothetical protein
MSDRRDIEAVIAARLAAMLSHQERVDAVQRLLHVDEIEARLLISHGRRLAAVERSCGGARNTCKYWSG